MKEKWNSHKAPSVKMDFKNMKRESVFITKDGRKMSKEEGLKQLRKRK